MTVDGKEVTFRAYENIPYVANPVDTTYQSMNVYIPEAYFQNEKDGKYTAESAPIFLPNSVGGYRPGKAATPTLSKDGEPNAVLYALSRALLWRHRLHAVAVTKRQKVSITVKRRPLLWI